MWRMRPVLAILGMVGVYGKRVMQASLQEDLEPPSERQQQKEFFQCSRQCRWRFGLELAVVGGRSGWSSCQCYRLKSSGFDVLQPVIPRYSVKTFDTKTTWSGTDTEGWDCDLVCVEGSDGELRTVSKDQVQSLRQLHCGACAACSAPKDIKVLAQTRSWITEVMTRIAARFAAPWGHHDPQRLRRDLIKAGIDFSETRYDGRTDLPSCMDVWADNIMCDAMSCKSRCWLKFFNPANAKTEITGKVPWYDLNAQCLRCDEMNCGPAFIKGAGANRRSTGIDSDIRRPEKQKCHMGMYSGVPPEELPTLPKPDI